MQDTTAIKRMETVYGSLAPIMDERTRRQWAAAEAQAYGWGGIRAVSTAIGMSANTIRKGLWELSEREADPEAEVAERVRQEGGGRKRQTDLDPGLQAALEQLIEPATRGDPQSPLRWTCKSTTRLAGELTKQGHPVSASTVGRLLIAAGYSLQGNRKTKEGADHPDRNAQFEHISATVQDFQQRGQPVIAVDTKKKELVGEFRNSGREWQPQGEPVEVLIHDFMDKDFGQSHPVWRLRSHGESGLGECGHRSRYGPVCDRSHPTLVAQDGREASSPGAGTPDHGGRWREQREPLPIVEGGTARLGHSPGPADSRLPLSTRNQQVEQNRAPHVLPYHAELARSASG